MRRFLILSIIAVLHAPFARADDTAITIYSKAQPGAIDPNTYRPVQGQSGYYGQAVPGYAVVRQTRKVSLPAAQSILKFSDVAALIDPTTVQFRSLTDPKGTKVAEQDYQFDLVSQQKLLEKYIDQKIAVQKAVGDKVETVEGTLLSVQGGLTLKMPDNGIQAINAYSSIRFPTLPGGLMTKPTLVWSVITGKPGDHQAEVSYQTEGITWWADYNLIYKDGKDANSGTVDFGSWVSIINQTGASFADARLKLMAGDVQRVSNRGYPQSVSKMRMEEEMSAPAPKFAEKAFFEYHLYTLNRPVTLPDNATKQMELIPAAGAVPVEKILVYYGSPSAYFGDDSIHTDRNDGLDRAGKKVDVYLKLLNKEENGLGVPLPAGRIRVNQRDDDGGLEFIGESLIGHTPRNEEVLIKLGSAFDVVGERKQLNFVLDTGRRFIEEEIEIKIRNRKKQPVKVKAVESLYRAIGWTITKSSMSYNKDDAHRVSFMPTIDSEKEEVIHYTVRYTW